MSESPPGGTLLASAYSLGYGGYVASLILVTVVAHDVYGADLFLTSIAFAAANISLFVCSFVFGRHADVHGRRRIMQAGLLLSGFTILLQVFIWDVWSLIAVRSLVGVTVAMFPPAILAYAHDSGWRMGRFASFGSLAWAIGAGLTMVSGLVGSGVFHVGAGPVRLALTGYHVTFILGSASVFVAYFLALRLPRIPEKRVEVERLPFRLMRKNAHVYFSFLVRHIGANAVWVTFPLYITYLGNNRADIGLFIGATNLINTFSQFVFMPWLDRVSRPRVLISAGMVATAATFVVFISFPDLYALLAAQVLLGFSWSMLYVGAIREIIDNNQEKATVTGLLSSTVNVAQVAGPVIGGVVAAWAFAGTGDTLWSYQSTMWLAAALALGGLAVQLALQSRSAAPPRPEEGGERAPVPYVDPK